MNEAHDATRKHPYSRREFLGSVVAATAGGLTMIDPSAADPTTRPAWTIACRDVHLREVGEKDSWSAMRAIGVDGAELETSPDGKCGSLFAPGETFSIATPDGIKALGERFQRERLRITAFCLHNAFDKDPEGQVQWTIRVMQAATKLGVPALRLDLWPQKLAGKDDEFMRFAIGIGKRLVDAAKDTPVRYGVENHGGTTNRPEFLRKLFEGVGSKQFGLTLDTGNFYWFGHPLSKLYTIYDEFGDYACHTHCKSIHYPEAERDKQRPMGWEYGKYNAPVYEGDIDFQRVTAILARHKYAGDLCIENEALGKFPTEQRREVLAREAKFLRSFAA